MRPQHESTLPPPPTSTMLDNFERLWRSRDPEIVKEIVAADAVAHWAGLGRFGGREYPEVMRKVMEGLPSLELEVTGHAAERDLLFISWKARALVDGFAVEWDGIDRFRLDGDLAVEVHAIFDTGPLRTAYERAAQGPPEAGTEE